MKTLKKEITFDDFVTLLDGSDYLFEDDSTKKLWKLSVKGDECDMFVIQHEGERIILNDANNFALMSDGSVIITDEYDDQYTFNVLKIDRRIDLIKEYVEQEG